ncbi:MAG TPA: hypothetical protein VK745_05080 [Polyangiaceae bacterium]|jgi:hypothetical protein|nr:hypothetical protein [Polyangiaceae bacterium]
MLASDFPRPASEPLPQFSAIRPFVELLETSVAGIGHPHVAMRINRNAFRGAELAFFSADRPEGERVRLSELSVAGAHRAELLPVSALFAELLDVIVSVVSHPQITFRVEHDIAAPFELAVTGPSEPNALD